MVCNKLWVSIIVSIQSSVCKVCCLWEINASSAVKSQNTVKPNPLCRLPVTSIGRSASYYEYARMGSLSRLSIRLRLIAIRAMATHLWYHIIDQSSLSHVCMSVCICTYLFYLFTAKLHYVGFNMPLFSLTNGRSPTEVDWKHGKQWCQIVKWCNVHSFGEL